MPDERLQTTFRIDQELLRRFRHALIDRELKMTPVIEKLIRTWLKEAEGVPPPHLSLLDAPRTKELRPELDSASNDRTNSSPIPVADPWGRILNVLGKKVSRHSYDRWLKATSFSHSDDRTLFVLVPNKEFGEMAERYADLILEAIDDLGLEFEDVEFITGAQQTAATQHPAANTPELRGSGLSGDARDSAPATPPPVSKARAQRFDWDSAAQLNPRYTFDGFVCGAGNEFAHAAAQAVAENPSKAYNPLFLYGGVGMGKTHLVQAIGHEVKKRQPQMSICYLSSERFTNEMINSLRYDKMASFRDKFRTVDVLLIDDIQFLAQKERTQEEFFHTFNALHDSMRQIVIASDRAPKELAEIEDRLRSRFEWGLIADIQPPDLETKVAILQRKAESERVQLPNDVALFIASNIRSNVRELEGALIRLLAHSSLIGQEITLSYAQQVLKKFIDSQQGRNVTIDSIQKAVAEQFGLRLSELKAKDNSRAIVFPRQIAMYLTKQLTDASTTEIGRQFGGKHSSTVLHSIDKIEEVRKIDKDLNRLLNRTSEMLSVS